MKLLFLAILQPARCVFAFGSTKVDVTETTGFVKEDNQRDTISLLISCFATLALCVYSAVHLNVPRKAERGFRTLLRELRWCVIGLFAPELILYTAWRQLASARQLRSIVNRTNGYDRMNAVADDKSVILTEGATQQPTRESPWTLAHGFYGSMGGFAIDIENADSHHTSLFGNNKRLTLTAKGLALLADCGQVPEISADDIKDKSKADGLAKLLVCIQAGWMIVQVTSRAATGLATTLLEVHTVAHVVCALVMYVLWWHKPRQVESPTILKGDWLWPLAMYMFLASRMSGETPPGGNLSFRLPVPELKKLAYFEEPHLDSRRQSREDDDTEGQFRIRHISSNREPTSPMPENEIKLRQRKLAEKAVSMYPALRSRFTPGEQDPTFSEPTHSIPYSTELVQPYALDWPNAGLLRRTQSLVMGMVLWGASMAYGAIHVAAWDYFFPTALERLFWHLSSVWVTFCAAFWLLTNLLAHFFPFIDRVWVGYNERKLGWLGTGVITVLCMLCGISYIVSRAYLVVEAFVSIRRVPSDVYQTPVWSQVFPHL